MTEGQITQDEAGEEIVVDVAIAEYEGTALLDHKGNIRLGDGFRFPLDDIIVKQLLWLPQEGPATFTGTYNGRIYWRWGDDADEEEEYVEVIVDGRSRLIKCWAAVKRGFEHVDIGATVMVLYRGTRRMKNGRTYHNIWVGVK